VVQVKAAQVAVSGKFSNAGGADCTINLKQKSLSDSLDFSASGRIKIGKRLFLMKVSLNDI
jgi:hypothetical protein